MNNVRNYFYLITDSLTAPNILSRSTARVQWFYLIYRFYLQIYYVQNIIVIVAFFAGAKSTFIEVANHKFIDTELRCRY